MSTTLANCRIALNRELGDHWASSATSNGAADGTTIVDTALKRFPNAWIADEVSMFDLMTSGTCDGEERKISSLANSSGTLTVLAHSAQIDSADAYEVHRLFTASDKKRALIIAAKNVYPHLFSEIFNQELVSGNWLSDGSFERWTSSTVPAIWAKTGSMTTTQTTTAPYYRHGATSCKLSGATGTLIQRWHVTSTQFDDLKNLRGKTVRFTLQAWCDTASALRLSINDGTTQTYSSYHAGDSAWTEDNPQNDSFYVEQKIAENATQVAFTIHFENASANAYVDDGRVISGQRSPLYIGHLNFANNRPHSVEIEPSYYSQREPWIPVRGWTVDNADYLVIPTEYLNDRRLRLRGIGILDFLASGASSELWTATIAIDEPQLRILVAEAALWLYQNMSMPNFDRSTREQFQQATQYWAQKSLEYREKFGMVAPPIHLNYTIR